MPSRWTGADRSVVNPPGEGLLDAEKIHWSLSRRDLNQHYCIFIYNGVHILCMHELNLNKFICARIISYGPGVGRRANGIYCNHDNTQISVGTFDILRSFGTFDILHSFGTFDILHSFGTFDILHSFGTFDILQSIVLEHLTLTQV